MKDELLNLADKVMVKVLMVLAELGEEGLTQNTQYLIRGGATCV